MSCSCTNCACGSSCNCGSKMSPDLSYAGEKSSRESLLVLGVASMKMEAAEMGVAATENEGCKCGSNCTCDPCNCK